VPVVAWWGRGIILLRLDRECGLSAGVKRGLDAREGFRFSVGLSWVEIVKGYVGSSRGTGHQGYRFLRPHT
jgi:hypothetical protein